MPSIQDELQIFRAKLDQIQLPQSVHERINLQITQLSRLTGNEYTQEADRVSRWLEWITSLPWNIRAPESLDLQKARMILDEHHYGLDEVKERILEYLAVLKLRQSSGSPSPTTYNLEPRTSHARAPILLLVGLVGTGKTTLAYSVAQATGRPVVRIPFGGMGSARDLRGQSRLHLEAEPGQVMKAIRNAGVKNPVMLLDELDRVAEEARHDIMGVLVELLDPEQNKSFVDHYLDIPFDLSEVLFITTANNTGNIATAVLDRLEPISMPSYTDEQKIIIAKKYLLPKAQEEAAIPSGSLLIDETAWPLIVRPLGYDAGIRTLQRTIQNLARKTAMQIVTGGEKTIHITRENLKNFVQAW